MAFPGDYNWKLDITSDSTKVDSNESNFPYYLDLSNIVTADFWNNVQSDGGDLRVSTDADGLNQVPLEVVSIDTVGETGEIWFKDDTDSASNKTYYLWWDDSTGTVSQPAVTGTYGRNNVWTVFAHVYHLEEDPGTENMIDSTGNNDLTTTNSDDTASGKIGNANDYESTNNDFDETVSHTESASAATVMAWFNRESSGVFQSPINFRSTNTDNFIVQFSDGDKIRFVWNGTSDYFDSTSTIGTTMTHLAIRVSTTPQKVFFDGVGEAMGRVLGSSNFSISSASGSLRIGARGDNVQYYDGIMDEVQIAYSDLGDNWITTTYNMQSSNATFWTIGTAQEAATEDTATVTSVSATPLTSTEISEAVEVGTVTSVSATPLGGAETSESLESATLTSANATPLIPNEAITEAAILTNVTATPLNSQELLSILDMATLTSASATPLSSTEIYDAVETAILTSVTATPLVPNESITAIASVTTVNATPLTAVQDGTSNDTAILTSVAATSITATNNGIVMETATVVSVSATPLIAVDINVGKDPSEILQTNENIQIERTLNINVGEERT